MIYLCIFVYFLYIHCFIVMLRVGHQNVYHLHNKVLDLSVFLNQSAPSYNLFGVTESRLAFRISDQDVNIPDYRIQRKDSTAFGQTGIAVYIHDSVTDITHRRHDLKVTVWNVFGSR